MILEPLVPCVPSAFAVRFDGGIALGLLAHTGGFLRIRFMLGMGG